MRKNKNKIISKMDILIFTEIFILWGVALLAFFPGLLTSDNVDQISQACNGLYKSSHPIIHSFIIGNLNKLGGIWIPALFQIITFGLIWTYICKMLRNYNNSKFTISKGTSYVKHLYLTKKMMEYQQIGISGMVEKENIIME